VPKRNGTLVIPDKGSHAAKRGPSKQAAAQ
jgi:hypothetical protein